MRKYLKRKGHGMKEPSEMDLDARAGTYGELHAKVLRGPMHQRLDRAWAAGHAEATKWHEGVAASLRVEVKALKRANFDLQQELKRNTKLADLLLEKYAGLV